MRHYNLRWVESGQWQTRERFAAAVEAVAGDILLVITSDETTGARVIALRVLTRVVTDPVTLICSMCGNPLKEEKEEPFEKEET